MTTIEAIMLHLEQVVPDVTTQEIFGGPGVNLPPPEATISRSGFLTVTDTGGRDRIKTHSSGSIKRPDFQITAYANDYLTAISLIEKVGEYVETANKQVGDVFFLTIFVVGEAFSLPLDTRGRARAALNISTMRR